MSDILPLMGTAMGAMTGESSLAAAQTRLQRAPRTRTRANWTI